MTKTPQERVAIRKIIASLTIRLAGANVHKALAALVPDKRVLPEGGVLVAAGKISGLYQNKPVGFAIDESFGVTLSSGEELEGDKRIRDLGAQYDIRHLAGGQKRGEVSVESERARAEVEFLHGFIEKHDINGLTSACHEIGERAAFALECLRVVLRWDRDLFTDSRGHRLVGAVLSMEHVGDFFVPGIWFTADDAKVERGDVPSSLKAAFAQLAARHPDYAQVCELIDFS